MREKFENKRFLYRFCTARLSLLFVVSVSFWAPCFSRNPSPHLVYPPLESVDPRARLYPVPSPFKHSLQTFFVRRPLVWYERKLSFHTHPGFLLFCLFVFWLFVGVFLAVHGKWKFFFHFPRVGKIPKAWESNDSLSTTSTPRSACSSPISSRCCCTVLKRGG